jgi:hypothetical protein
MQLGSPASEAAGNTRNSRGIGGGAVVQAPENYLPNCGGYEFNRQLKYASISLLEAPPRQCGNEGMHDD